MIKFNAEGLDSNKSKLIKNILDTLSFPRDSHNYEIKFKQKKGGLHPLSCFCDPIRLLVNRKYHANPKSRKNNALSPYIEYCPW